MKYISFAAVAAALAYAPFAEAQVQTIPVDEAAAAFGKLEMIQDISMSPDGQNLVVIVPAEGQSNGAHVVNVASGATKGVISADGDPFRLTDCDWAGNVRLVCNHYGLSNVSGQMLPFTRLIAVNADGSDMEALGQDDKKQQLERVRQFDGTIIDWLGGKDGVVLMSREYVPIATTYGAVGSPLEGLGVDRLDTRTRKDTRIEPPRGEVVRYYSDGAGNIRMKASDGTNSQNRTQRGYYEFSYRKAGSDEWLPFSRYDGSGGMWPLAVDGGENAAYVLQDHEGRDALFRVALDGSMKSELVFARPDVDVSGIVRLGRAKRIIGVRYVTDRAHAIYFDPEFRKLSEDLSKALPGLPLVNFVSSSDDESKLLLFASSDTDPGRYYVYDRETRRLNEMLLERPPLERVRLAQVKSVSYKNSEGIEIPAYLTVPVGSDGKNLPAIVMPHGGPAARDEWGFDWLAQFYVSQGFAVLQPNYRGSAGYGDAWFAENGFRSWKLAISDVNDGARWMVQQGIADPSKLAIVGWSYGGYAALQANVVDPDLFKAVVAIAPVTDLEMLKREALTFTSSKVVAEYVGSGPHIEEGSPARHAERFKAPVMLFHGDRDLNVGVGESKLMHDQLRDEGKRSKLVVYPKADHQLPSSEYRADMLKKSAIFLKTELGLQ